MFRNLLAVVAIVGLVGGEARAQATYPNRPITMIVPFAAGGTSDVIARIVGEEMSMHLGQRLVPENIGGAGGILALSRAARAAPDGYTIVMGNSGTNAAAYSIHDNLQYTPDNFVPVGLTARTFPVIAVKKGLAAQTLAEFIAHARANPGQLNLGHAGVGSSNYLICRQFLAAANIQVTLVSYRGASPALQDVMVGSLDGVCDAATSVASAVNAGEARGLVVSAPARLSIMPGVPTSTEAGLPAFEAQGWNGVFVPRGTPPEVVARLQAALVAAVSSDFVVRRFAELGASTPGADERTPAFLGALVQREIVRFRALMGPRR